MMKVLIGANPMGLENGIPKLQERYPDIEFAVCPTREDTVHYIGDADIYMGWLNQEAFVAAKKLKWIQSPSSGVNYYLEIPELLESDVLLTSASGTHGACVAESAMAMILSFTRGIRPAILRQQAREWAGAEIRRNMMELTETTMGIIGLGAIGRALAKRAKAFEMRVIAVDLYPDNKPDYADELWGLDRLNDLMAESDFVVIMVPYTEETANMVGAEQLAHMKPSAMLVAMSRGGILDQDALVTALKEKQLAAAALDVFKPEPLGPEHELWGMENVLVTPHIAGGTQYEGRYILRIFTENLDRLRKGQLPLHNQVDKQRGF